jgi:hypothetical protein
MRVGQDLGRRETGAGGHVGRAHTMMTGR